MRFFNYVILLTLKHLKKLSSNELLDRKLYYNIANRVVKEMLEIDFNLVATVDAKRLSNAKERSKIIREAINAPLHLLGVNVYAPIDVLYIKHNGVLNVGDSFMSEEEGFKTFKPKKVKNEKDYKL